MAGYYGDISPKWAFFKSFGTLRLGVRVQVLVVQGAIQRMTGSLGG